MAFDGETSFDELLGKGLRIFMRDDELASAKTVVSIVVRSTSVLYVDCVLDQPTK
jgi:hypothetical protein